MPVRERPALLGQARALVVALVLDEGHQALAEVDRLLAVVRDAEQEEQIGTHPKGRQFYATAMKDMDAKRWSDAQRNLKMALTYERDNARYKEKLAEVDQKLHEEFKAKGDQFKIR